MCMKDLKFYGSLKSTETSRELSNNNNNKRPEKTVHHCLLSLVSLWCSSVWSSFVAFWSYSLQWDKRYSASRRIQKNEEKKSVPYCTLLRHSFHFERIFNRIFCSASFPLDNTPTNEDISIYMYAWSLVKTRRQIGSLVIFSSSSRTFNWSRRRKKTNQQQCSSNLFETKKSLVWANEKFILLETTVKKRNQKMRI